jgi:hypothetical protein
LPGGILNTNTFNGDGLRVAVADSTGTRSIVWDQQAYLLETAPSGTTTVVYTNEPAPFGGLISQYRGGQPSFYHFDGLGHIALLRYKSSLTLRGSLIRRIRLHLPGISRISGRSIGLAAATAQAISLLSGRPRMRASSNGNRITVCPHLRS